MADGGDIRADLKRLGREEGAGLRRGCGAEDGRHPGQVGWRRILARARCHDLLGGALGDAGNALEDRLACGVHVDQAVTEGAGAHRQFRGYLGEFIGGHSAFDIEFQDTVRRGASGELPGDLPAARRAESGVEQLGQGAGGLRNIDALGAVAERVRLAAENRHVFEQAGHETGGTAGRLIGILDVIEVRIGAVKDVQIGAAIDLGEFFDRLERGVLERCSGRAGRGKGICAGSAPTDNRLGKILRHAWKAFEHGRGGRVQIEFRSFVSEAEHRGIGRIGGSGFANEPECGIPEGNRFSLVVVGIGHRAGLIDIGEKSLGILRGAFDGQIGLPASHFVIRAAISHEHGMPEDERHAHEAEAHDENHDQHRAANPVMALERAVHGEDRGLGRGRGLGPDRGAPAGAAADGAVGAAAGEPEGAGVGEVNGTVVQGTRISIPGGVAEGEADAEEENDGEGAPAVLAVLAVWATGSACWISTRMACGRLSGVEEDPEEVPEVESAELKAQLVCQLAPS